MPTEYAEESFFDRPISSVIINYELVIFHVLRQLPERHKWIPFRFAFALFLVKITILTVLHLMTMTMMMMINIIGEGRRINGGFCFIHILHFGNIFFSPYQKNSFSETHDNSQWQEFGEMIWETLINIEREWMNELYIKKYFN